MYKLINLVFFFVLFLLVSACTSGKKQLSEDGVKGLASMYASYYNETLYKIQPVIVTYKDTLVWEALYIDDKRERIGVRTFAQPPYKQYLDIIEANNEIGFYEASEHIDSKVLNYFASDCPSVKKALADYKKVGLDYNHGNSYKYNSDKAVYTYVYIEHENGGQTIEISTYIAEHPVSEIYRIVKKGVDSCQHPKEPPIS